MIEQTSKMRQLQQGVTLSVSWQHNASHISGCVVDEWLSK